MRVCVHACAACVGGSCPSEHTWQTNATASPAPWGVKGPRRPPALPYLVEGAWVGSPRRRGGGRAAAGRASSRWCPLPGVIYHFRLLTWGPGPSLLRWAAARALPGGGRPRGRGAPGQALGRRRRGPGLRRGLGGGRKLPEQIRAEVGPAVRQCGTPPPPPSLRPARPRTLRSQLPGATVSPSGPLPPTPGVDAREPWGMGLQPAHCVSNLSHLRWQMGAGTPVTHPRACWGWDRGRLVKPLCRSGPFVKKGYPEFLLWPLPLLADSPGLIPTV